MSDCVVVLSGGADSTICAALSQGIYEKVHAITFNYGQRHQIEIEAATSVAQELGLDSHEILSLGGEVLKSTSPLVSNNKVDEYSSVQELPGGVANTFVPNRNQLFLTIAANRAIAAGIDILVTGVCQTDYSGYPDCRRDFIDSLQDSISLGNFGELGKFMIVTPLMEMTKAESVLLAKDVLGDRFDAVLRLTHTCYQGVVGGCGKCAACLLRDKGFREAGIDDPLWELRNVHSLC